MASNLARTLLGLALLAGGGHCLAIDAPEDAPPFFPLRIIQLGGPLERSEVTRHLEFSIDAGFNAIWVPGEQAGRWTATRSPTGPVIDPRFLELAAWADERGVRLFVAIRPHADSGGHYIYTDPVAGKRLRKFVRLLYKKAGVREFVLSFQESPPRLSELADLMEYGRIAAGAHVELTRSVQRRLPRGARLWLLPTVASDDLLEDSRVRYSGELLETLATLEPSVGIVWHGPATPAVAIGPGDLAASRQRLGSRPFLLRDLYPANHGGGRIPLALVLGPLRQRAPEIAGEVDGYLCSPMEDLDASRLPLLTVADYLRDPVGYDAEASLSRAMQRLAGPRTEALRALDTQVLEWGGWIGTRNYHTAMSHNPHTAAAGLRDPAVVASWSWTVRRYPERMAALESLADQPFRDALLETMARRMTVARAVPVVRELQARVAAGRDDIAELLQLLGRERERVKSWPTAQQALDRFLEAAGLAELVLGRSTAETPP